jgi:hypothetical protein
MIFNKRALYTIIVFIILLLIGYLWYVDELQFIGQKTQLTKAQITKTRFHHIGRGYYMQNVVYEFTYKNKKYIGEFEAGKIMGKRNIGEYVQIKFSTYNPDHSKLIGVYNK